VAQQLRRDLFLPLEAILVHSLQDHGSRLWRHLVNRRGQRNLFSDKTVLINRGRDGSGVVIRYMLPKGRSCALGLQNGQLHGSETKPPKASTLKEWLRAEAWPKRARRVPPPRG